MGFFPLINHMYIIIHGVVAIIYFLSAMIMFIIFSNIYFKDNRVSKFHSFYGFILTGIVIIFFITWLPLIEWIMKIAIIVWVFINSSYLIHYRY
ncbi:MAG: hypothetical protein ACFFAO_06940 [Candidatus Hermodarchaeota archaeon]